VNKNFVRGKIVERYGSAFEFSKVLGISESLLSMWLSSRRPLPLWAQAKMVELLEVERGELLPVFDEGLKKIVRRNGSRTRRI
jgi:hypothetical protein